jgi:hypothetical protein
MGKSDQKNAPIAGQESDNPVVVVGEPRSLRGHIRVHNTGENKIVLKELGLRGAPGPVGKAPTAEPGISIQVPISAVISPGQSQRVPLTLDLDFRTPPGTYYGEVQIAGSARPLVMHVAETVRLSVSPKEVIIDRAAGSRVLKRVIFSNSGNVPVTVGEIGEVMLGEELLLANGVRGSMGSVSDRRKPLEKLFVEILGEETRAITMEVGSLMVRNLSAPLVLQPGDVQAIDLEITLPNDLKPNSRYRARLPLYTADLEFVIVPGASHANGPKAGS